MKRFALFVLLLVSVVFPTTTVTVDDCKIKIDVKVAFAGDGASDAFIQKFEKAVKDKWQDKGFKYGDCECPVEISLTTKKFVTCYQAGKDYHCFDVKNTGGFFFSYVRPTLYSDGSVWQNGTMRGARGELSTSNTENIIGHEFGHLMGLKDEYYYVYYYWYMNADGTVKSGPHAVKVSEYNDQKKQEIQNGAPSGTTVRYSQKPDRSYAYVKYEDGVPTDSLMLNIDGNPKVYQHHINNIIGGAGIDCPDECCCGNGRIELGKEECDYKANPAGCMQGEECTKKCICEFIEAELPPAGFCGDTLINGDEECDPAAMPNGCMAGEECSSECICILPEKPPSDIIFTIDNPSDGSVLTGPEPVILAFSDPGRILYINYWVDGYLAFQSIDPGYPYLLDTDVMEEGEHTLLVQAVDNEMRDINESITFTVEMLQ